MALVSHLTLINNMCELFLSVFIVGAVESTPGWMTIDYIRKSNLSGLERPNVEQVVVPTDDYLDCWE